MSISEELTRLHRLPAGPELVAGLAALGPIPRRLTDHAGVREVLSDSRDQVAFVAKVLELYEAWRITL